MIYECHITLPHDQKTGDYVRVFLMNVFPEDEGLRWKSSEISRDIILGDDTYLYLTAHDTQVERMFYRMRHAAAWFRDHGVLVIREKIELILYDTKVPQT